jgi:hypothetical protein
VTADAPAPELRAFKHIDARQRWGEPDAWEGSVNDPRTRQEYGVRYNEKWIYLLPDGSRRLVYWHRYDCRGVRVERPDGRVVREDV